MKVMMKLCCICPSGIEYERREDWYEMSADFAAIPRLAEKIVLPLAKEEERSPDQPLEFTVENVSWEVSRGEATPVLHFTITNEWGAEKQWMAARGWTHTGVKRIRPRP